MSAKQVTVSSAGVGSPLERSESAHPHASADTHASETSPLLPHGCVNHADNENEERKSSRLSRRLIIIAMALTIVVASSSDKFLESPQQRIVESVICYEYYEKADPSQLLAPRETVGPGAIGGVPEMLCKINPVQDRLAKLNGYRQLFDALPSLLLAIPYGWAADRYGRRPFILLALLGNAVQQTLIHAILWFWQIFDVRLIWLSSASGIMGGGPIAVTGLLLAAISDLTHPDERATLFLQMVAANLGSGLVMPLAAAWLMRINPWIPALCGTLLAFVALAVYLPVPETLNYLQHGSVDQQTTTDLDDTTTEVCGTSSLGTLPAGKSWLELVEAAMAVFTRDWRVPALVLTFVAHYLCSDLSRLLMQYISKRYSVSFSTATLILTVRTAATMVLLLAILPGLSHVITTRWRLPPQRKDLILSRASAVFWSLGFFLIGFAPNIGGIIAAFAIGSLGVGMSVLLRAFLTSLVPSNQVARVYACITIIDTVGVMIGSPLLAWLFEVGLSIGGTGVGLPFHFLGLLNACIVIVSFMVRLEKGEGEEPAT